MSEVQIVIDAKMEERWVGQFIGMLEQMQLLGRIGASRTLAFFSDGDGDFNPKFSYTFFDRAAYERITVPEEGAPLLGKSIYTGDQIFDAG